MMASDPNNCASPLGAVVRGVVAGVAGTAAMTAWQEISKRLQGETGDGRSADGDRDPWESAPVPAKVGKRVLEGVFQRSVPAERIGLLANAAHWGYGTVWGAVFGLIQSTARRNPLRHGLLFGTGVWAMSYVQLVPMGLYRPPWEYAPTEVALDVSYHVVYGLGVGATYALFAGELG